MNQLSTERQVQVLTGLMEGNSIRSIERMTGTHRDTITKLLRRVGDTCEGILNEKMRGLPCSRIEVDEIWTFVYKKQRHLTKEESRDRRDWGDQYVFVALDPDSKLVPTFAIGKRNYRTAERFLWDLKGRLQNRVQITTDSFDAYTEAVPAAWRGKVDYAQLVKMYCAENPGRGRYSPPRYSEVVSRVICGEPQKSRISTSYVERHNLSMRTSCRRFTRLTNGFSKSLENLRAALALYFVRYNFVRVHRTLRVTPAMQAGIVTHIWKFGNLL